MRRDLRSWVCHTNQLLNSSAWDIHTNALLTPRSLETLAEIVIHNKRSVQTAAAALAVSEPTARKSVARFGPRESLGSLAFLLRRCYLPRLPCDPNSCRQILLKEGAP